jgi:MFS family permease
MRASTGVVVTGQTAPALIEQRQLIGEVLMAVAIPAPLVVSGQGLPRVCVRHGEPADRHKRVLFRSKTPGWTYLLVILGVIVFAIVAAVLQKRVKAPAWPFCPRCADLRTRRLLIGIGLVVLSVVAVVVLAGALPADSSYGPLAVVAFVVLLFAGLIFIALAGWAAIASAFASRDGTAVEVRRPAARYVAEAAPAQQWELQQRAAHEQAARQWTAGHQPPS